MTTLRTLKPSANWLVWTQQLAAAPLEHGELADTGRARERLGKTKMVTMVACARRFGSRASSDYIQCTRPGHLGKVAKCGGGSTASLLPRVLLCPWGVITQVRYERTMHRAQYHSIQ